MKVVKEEKKLKEVKEQVSPESAPIVQTIIEESPKKKESEPAPLNVTAPVLLQEKATEEKSIETNHISEPVLDLDWKKTLKRHELQQEATIDGEIFFKINIKPI